MDSSKKSGKSKSKNQQKAVQKQRRNNRIRQRASGRRGVSPNPGIRQNEDFGDKNATGKLEEVKEPSHHMVKAATWGENRRFCQFWPDERRPGVTRDGKTIFEEAPVHVLHFVFRTGALLIIPSLIQVNYQAS